MYGNESNIMEEEMDTCPICSSPLKSSKGLDDYDRYEYNCYRCGKYKITEELLISSYLKNLTDKQRVLISGWIRENQGSDIIIDKEKLKSLMSLPELSMFEKADKMLLYLAKKFPVAGMNIEYEFNEANSILCNIEKKTFPERTDQYSIKTHKNAEILLPLIAVSRIINSHEFSFVFSQYLVSTKHYISEKYPKIITPKGWAYLETFRHPNPESKKAFVAMWFTDEMREIHEEYIKPATLQAGEYEAKTIDEKDFNGDINDEIIGEIRSSKFIIADFTGNRGGVYYEAGFADGFNIPVIYTCREDHLKDVHFDVNHRKIIKWKDGKDLYKKLLNRIKATIV